MTEHCIAGYPASREAFGKDLEKPAFLVTIPRGLSSTRVSVYGDGLSEGDAKDAAVEWLEGKGETVDAESRSRAYAVALSALRTRYIWAVVEERPYAMLILRVARRLQTLVRDMFLNTAAIKPETEVVLVAPMDLAVVDITEADLEKTKSWLAVRGQQELRAGYLPDNLSPLCFNKLEDRTLNKVQTLVLYPSVHEARIRVIGMNGTSVYNSEPIGKWL